MTQKRIQAVDLELAALRDGVDAAIKLIDESAPAASVIEKAINFLDDKGVETDPLVAIVAAMRRRGPRLNATDITLVALRDGMNAAVELIVERRPTNDVVEEAAAFLEDKGINADELRRREARPTDALPTLNIKDLKRIAVEQAIAKHPGNFSAAIRELGCGRTTFYRHLHAYGLMNDDN